MVSVCYSSPASFPALSRRYATPHSPENLYKQASAEPTDPEPPVSTELRHAQLSPPVKYQRTGIGLVTEEQGAQVKRRRAVGTQGDHGERLSANPSGLQCLRPLLPRPFDVALATVSATLSS